MKENNFLITAALWLLNITRGLAVIAFLLLVYFVSFEGVKPSLTLPLGYKYNFLTNLEPIVMPEGLETLFRDAWIRSAGYRLEIGVTGSNIIFYILVIGIILGLYIFFATLLYKIVKSSQAKDFFNLKNVFRLRLIGFSLIGLDILSRLIGFFTRRFYDNWFDPEGLHSGSSVRVVPDLFNNWIFLGLFVLILAQAFDHGLKLKEEQELTI